LPIKNIPVADMIFAHLFYLKDMIGKIEKIRRTYRNYLTIVLHILRKKYPVQGILRNGNYITLGNLKDVLCYVWAQGYEGIEFDLKNDSAIISLPGYPSSNPKNVIINGIRQYSSAWIIIFLGGEYGYLPTEGRTVIDLGAQSGDSAVYFALHGADKVIALEPLRVNYEMAKINIDLNNVSNRITLLLAGCSSNPGYIGSDLYSKGDIKSYQEDDIKNGNLIPLLTLGDILTQNKIQGDGLVLKMDCEGYEYDIILSATAELLRQFSYIQVEYHYGYKNLKEKLEKCGFNVSFSRPRAVYIYQSQKQHMLTKYAKGNWVYVGYIYAKRN